MNDAVKTWSGVCCSFCAILLFPFIEANDFSANEKDGDRGHTWY